jgi:hypothetical protein
MSSSETKGSGTVGRSGTVGLGVIVGLALGAMGATSAFAVLPEVGRCVAQVGGNYTDGNCTVKKTGGSFEFVKNAIRKNFTEVGGEVKPQFASGSELKCTSSSATGEYREKGSTPSTKEVQNVKVIYKGCELPLFAVSCETKGAASGEVVWKALEGTLYYISGKGTASVKVAQSLTPEAKKLGFAEFECPAVGIVPYIGEGAEKDHETYFGYIGPLNVMATTATEEYKKGAKEGVQDPNHKEGSTVIDNLEISLSGSKGTFEGLDIVDTVTIANEEALEIKA